MIPKEIAVRDLTKQDIPFILNYWFHSPPSFIESIGVDVTKLPSEEEMRKFLEDKCENNSLLAISKLNALVILADEQPVGFHTINPLNEGEDGIFHAHIWNKDFRGKGVAKKSYPLACSIFMQRFNLKKILFKTPQQNTAAIKIKESLGIRFIGEENVNFGILKGGTTAKVFELKSEDLL